MNRHLRKPGSLLVLLILLCTVLGTGAAQETAPLDILTLCRDVMLGTRPYRQVDPFEGTVTETFMTPSISQWYGYQFDPPIKYNAFAVTDLDHDGDPELLVRLAEDFGFELLRFYDGAVYGYPFVARAMEAVTADGEIHVSAGASNFGWLTLYFEGGDMLRSAVCWMSDEETDAYRCTIGGAVVSKSEFDAFNETMWNKEMLEWTDYTPEALDDAVAGE